MNNNVHYRQHGYVTPYLYTRHVMDTIYEFAM